MDRARILRYHTSFNCEIGHFLGGSIKTFSYFRQASFSATRAIWQVSEKYRFAGEEV